MKLLTATALVLSLAITGTAQFRSGVDLVSFVVVATDKKGVVTTLTKDDFTLLEDGKPQQIQFFAQGDVSARMPLRLGLLFDTSGSMMADIEMAKTAVIKFMNAVEHAQDTTLVDFDTEIRLARYGQDDYPRLFERIRQRKADGWTALYDAIGTYLNRAGAENGQKVLVLYTDGGDSRSRMTITQVLDMLKLVDVTVYAVGFVDHQGSARHELRASLQRLASATGGQAYFPSSKDELTEMYDKILAEINGRYTLGYVSSNTEAKNDWRKVEIKVTNPAYKSVKIRTRPGYYAPVSSAQR
jgi:VWFA-related protein